MKAIPQNLIHLKTIAQVPVSEYSELAPTNAVECANEQQRRNFLARLRRGPVKASSQQKTDLPREMTFNAVAWLRFVALPTRPVSLWLSYEDAQGRQQVLVDEQLLSDGHTLMLSGSAKLVCHGLIKWMTVALGGIAEHRPYALDEISVRRDTKAVSNTRPKKRALA